SESLAKTRLWQPGEPEFRQTGDDTGFKQAEPEGNVKNPGQIGRYRIERVLGKGAFGTVYRGYDDDLKRFVAIKVPHRHLVDKPEDIDLYLEEAQVIASLDHANIVPVYDVGRTEDGLCYVVSKFIEGTNLAARIGKKPLSHDESAGLVMAIAEALHHAHLHMVVHRDVKPANILIDATGKPYLADFGLALKEEHFGGGSGEVGTPAYMSPEQARGEGHLVDGRADIFSLGVVFYELLTATRPFWGASREETTERIRSLEARPPRQLDDSIPKELERICLKALSKRARDRYTTALDMAEDLRHFLAQTAELKPIDSGKVEIQSIAPAAPPAGSDSGKPRKIVPKGLRSFDAEDADFFPRLLPGPRDRDGLPGTIRFWKYRIEETNSDKTFRVGLIYGPSGCGKSSLVKAGLLPRLAEHVISIYVEATTDDTEARLLRGLRKQCPGLQGNLGLKDSIAALRRGRGIPPGKKVLIILDQFEQWLHAKPSYASVELVEALRHCDGERVQFLVMVRDDFWMAITRFMRELEIELVEGQNSTAVDLFDIDHAKKVLAAFGRAFGKLPEKRVEPGKEQTAFLEQAASGLAVEGKVVCVRLALFAEMMKGKPWTPASLKAVGGTEGVGATYLEETFSAAAASPEHRYHQKAARAVLKALLPASGTDIKGQMRSYADLLNASGYSSRPRDFQELIRILDGESRLITPTDPEGKEDDSASEANAGDKYYQLTHDYLVHSLRDWLTRKQKETRRGRAELLLADRASVWNARPENRQLPSLLQWFQIKWLTQRKNWTPPQREMMRKAGRIHALHAVIATSLLVVLVIGSKEVWGRIEAKSLVAQLVA
ncbi:MAG: serine/threonine-protein kinase, partial [Thermoguttaceae bacterium]